MFVIDEVGGIFLCFECKIVNYDILCRFLLLEVKVLFFVVFDWYCCFVFDKFCDGKLVGLRFMFWFGECLVWVEGIFG